MYGGDVVIFMLLISELSRVHNLDRNILSLTNWGERNNTCCLLKLRPIVFSFTLVNRHIAHPPNETYTNSCEESEVMPVYV